MNKQTTFRFLKVERVAGIEPASLAWKAKVLPLNYTRALTIVIKNKLPLVDLIGGGGRIRTFEGIAVRFTV